MIRRTPTLIPLNDSDVEDVRNMVAKQKADGERKQRAMARMKEVAERPLEAGDARVLRQLKDIVQERNARLGIQKGASTSGS
jgi:hypothetical protein